MFRAALFAPALLLPFLLGQAPGPALRRSTPATNDLGMVVRQAGTVPVATLDGGSFPVTLPVSQTSAFGALLAVQETVPFFLSFPYNNINPEYVTTSTDGGGTVTADGGHAVLSVTLDGGFADMRSRFPARYIPGQGLSARFTFTSTGCAPGQVQTIGVGDSQDGFFFGCCDTCSADAGSSFGVLRRASGVDNWVPASSWNGMYGTTPPNIAFGIPYQIQWQWLGYGQVTFSIEDPTTGGFVVAHAIKYAGTSGDTSISNPNLPLNARVTNNRSNSVNILRTPSMAIVRQGLETHDGIRNSATGTITLATAAERQVLSIRNNSTFNGRVNRSLMYVDFISYLAGGSGAQDVILRIRLNDTLITPSFTPINTNTSLASWNIDGGVFVLGVDGGVALMPIVIDTPNSATLNLTGYNIHLAPGDVLTITGIALAGTPDLRVALSWIEEF